MTIWVTGATGTIGRPLCKRLLAQGEHVVALVRDLSMAPNGVDAFRWSLRDGIQEIDAPNPRVVVHLASQTSAYIARSSPTQDAETNVVGSVRLLEQLKNRGAQPFVLLPGAATEVGNHSWVSDNLPDDPPTFYEVGKVATRQYLEQYRREGWLDYAVLRLTNVYGGLVRGGQGAGGRGFIDRSIAAALRGEAVTYFEGPGYERDYLHVVDVVEAFALAIEKAGSLSGSTLMVSSGLSTPVADALALVAKLVGQVTGQVVILRPEPSREGIYDIDKRSTTVSSNRFRSLTQWSPSIDLEEGILMAIESQTED